MSFGGILQGNNIDLRGFGMPAVGQLQTDGQLYIAKTGSNPLVGSLTSPDGSITIGYSSPNITLQSGGAVATTYVADSGSATPSGNILNVFSIGEATTIGSGNTLSVKAPRVAKFVVDPDSNNGTNQTIQSAINGASSGDTIFIRPGTYTENLTLKSGVNLTAFTCDAFTPNVTIVGKITFTVAGTASISGINLQTNSDFVVSVTGSAASILNFIDCKLNGTNNTLIQYTSSSSSSQINFTNCNANLATTGIALYTQSSTGILSFRNVSVFNTGGSTTASSNSAGTVSYSFCGMLAPVSTSSSGTISGGWSSFNTSAQNATSLTTAGTGTSSFEHSNFSSGTASAISIGAGTVVQLFGNCSVDSTNTNALTGAGTLKFGMITFTNNSSGNNVTTQTSLQVQNIGQTATAFTPGLAFGGASTGITYTNQTGLYSVVKNIVYFTVEIILSSKGSATGVATITGFPVTVSSSAPASVNAMPFFQGLTLAAGATSLSCNMTGGATTGAIWQSGTLIGASQLTNTNFSGTDVFVFSGFYFI